MYINTYMWNNEESNARPYFWIISSQNCPCTHH